MSDAKKIWGAILCLVGIITVGNGLSLISETYEVVQAIEAIDEMSDEMLSEVFGSEISEAVRNNPIVQKYNKMADDAFSVSYVSGILRTIVGLGFCIAGTLLLLKKGAIENLEEKINKILIPVRKKKPAQKTHTKPVNLNTKPTPPIKITPQKREIKKICIKCGGNDTSLKDKKYWICEDFPECTTAK